MSMALWRFLVLKRIVNIFLEYEFGFREELVIEFLTGLLLIYSLFTIEIYNILEYSFTTNVSAFSRGSITMYSYCLLEKD